MQTISFPSFKTFCAFNKIDEDLAQTIASAINAAVKKDHEEDIDDNDVVCKPDEWKHLSKADVQRKTKNFLRKIAHAGIDAANLRPFIKNLNVGEDPYRNKFGEKVKTFSDPRFGHSANESSILFPNTSGQGHQ